MPVVHMHATLQIQTGWNARAPQGRAEAGPCCLSTSLVAGSEDGELGGRGVALILETQD